MKKLSFLSIFFIFFSINVHAQKLAKFPVKMNEFLKEIEKSNPAWRDYNGTYYYLGDTLYCYVSQLSSGGLKLVISNREKRINPICYSLVLTRDNIIFIQEGNYGIDITLNLSRRTGKITSVYKRWGKVIALFPNEREEYLKENFLYWKKVFTTF